MNDIAHAIEQLARLVEHEDPVVHLWAVASLAARLGVVAVLADACDPVEAVAEIGDLWADQVVELLEEHPGRKAEVMSAVQVVMRRLLDAVQARDRQPEGTHP